MATLTSLGFSIFTTYDGDGIRRARRDINDLDGAINRTSGGLNSFTGRLGAAATAAIALGPALLPIGEAALSVTGTLAAMGTVAGTALGVYTAATAGAISRTLEMAEAGKKLTASQTTFVGAVNNMKNAWEDFIVSTQDMTLSNATIVVNALTQAIGKLEPIVRAVNPLIRETALAFADWVDRADGLQRFIDLVIQFGVPALENMTQAGRDILAVLGIAFRALLPLVVPLSEAIARGAAALREWAEQGGFQRFVDRVIADGPAVAAFFRSLWSAFMNIVAVMRELAPLSLQLATTMLQLIGNMDPEVVAALATAFLALKAATTGLLIPMAAMRLIFGGGTGILGIMGRLLPLFLRTAGIIGALIGVIILAWQHSQFFRDSVKELWGQVQILWRDHLQPLIQKLQELWDKLEPVRVLIGQVAGFIGGIFVQQLTNATGTLGLLVDGVGKLVDGLNWLIERLPGFAAAIAAWVVQTAQSFAGWVSQTAQGFAGWVVQVGQSIGGWVTQTAQSIAGWVTDTALAIAGWVTQTAQSIAGWVTQTLGEFARWWAEGVGSFAAWSFETMGIIMTWVAETVAAIAGWIVQMLAEFTRFTVETVASIAGWVVQMVAEFARFAAETVAAIAGWIVQMLGEFTRFVTETVAAITGWVVQMLGEFTSFVTQTVAAIAGWIVQMLGEFTRFVTETVAAIAGWIVQMLGEFTSFVTQTVAAITGWVGQMVAEFTRFISETVASITSWASDTLGIITDWIADVLAGIGDFAADIIQALEDCWNTVRETAADVWADIVQVIEDAINTLLTPVNMLIDGFNNIASALDLGIEIPNISVNFAYGGMVGSVPKFADGGVLGFARGGVAPGASGPGRDRVPAMLTPGEGVLVPEAVSGLGGPGFVHAANSHFSHGRTASTHGRHGTWNKNSMGGFGQMEHAAHPFADGGIVGGAQSFAMGGITLAALARAGLGGVSITQPEYNPGVAASAGTHDGGGVVDLPADPSILAALLATGEWAAWMRGNGDGMSPHIHAVLMSHPDLSPAAAAQVQSFLAGGTGLGVGGGGGGVNPFAAIFASIKEHIGEILRAIYQGASLGDAVSQFVSSAVGGVLGSMVPGSDEEDSGGLFGTGIGPDIGPDVAGAVGEVIEDVAGAVGSVAGGVTDVLTGGLPLLGMVLAAVTRTAVEFGFGLAREALDALNLPGGLVGDMFLGMGERLLLGAIDWVTETSAAKAPDASMFTAPTAGAGAGPGTAAWEALAAQALSIAGLSSSQLGAFLALMQAESGGNPNAINLTDSNAAIGQPSQGLMQVIPSTFAAYRDPSLPNNILDPLANMVAAANYIQARYGGNVPGSPYGMGTPGGHRGWHLVGEHGPEWMKFRGGEKVEANSEWRHRVAGADDDYGWGGGDVVFNFNGPTDYNGVKRAVAEAMPELRRAMQQRPGRRAGRRGM